MRARIWIVVGAIVTALLLVWLRAGDDEPAVNPPEPNTADAQDDAQIDAPESEPRRRVERTPAQDAESAGTVPVDEDLERAGATIDPLRRYQRAQARGLMLPLRKQRLRLEALLASGRITTNPSTAAQLDATLVQGPVTPREMGSAVQEAVRMSTAAIETAQTRVLAMGRMTQARLDEHRRALAGARDAAAWFAVLAQENDGPDPVILEHSELIRELESTLRAQGSASTGLPDTPSVEAVRAEQARTFLKAVAGLRETGRVALQLHVLLARAHANEIGYDSAVGAGRELTAERPNLDIEEAAALGLLEWYAGPLMTELRAR